MSSPDDQARTITSIIGGCIVVAVAICIIVVVGIGIVRSIRSDLDNANAQIEAIRKDMDLKRAGGQIVTLEDLMKPYKKHLLQSAFDLQSRLGVQLGTLGKGKFLNEFSKREIKDRDYAISSTIYFFAEFLGWLEVIRSKVVFVTGSEYAESLNSLLDSIRYQLTGETAVQGVPPKSENLEKNSAAHDVNHKILQLYIVDIRSIGNAMLVGHDDFIRPMTVDLFLQKFDPILPLPGALPSAESLEREVSQMAGSPAALASSLKSFNERPMTAKTREREEQKIEITKEAVALEREKATFNKIMEPLRKHIIQLTDMDPDKSDKVNQVPIRRLAILQVLLCKLIAILDDANPWDSGPKFDQNEEPRYIQRDIRLTPAVKFLSNIQREFLRDQVFFQDDSSFSFPGFREDLKAKSQAERDDLLWPGACPPLEPKKRPIYFNKKDKSVVHNQGMALTSAGKRKMSQPAIHASGAKAGESAPPSPTKPPGGGWGNFVGIFSMRGAGGKAHNQKVYPTPGASSSNVRSAFHTQQSKGKVHARFGSDVAGGSTREDGGVQGQGLVPPTEASKVKRPLSTIHSVPDLDLEGGREGLEQLRESAELPIADTDKKD